MSGLRYRRIKTSIHDDEWFKSLTPGARNLYLNIIPCAGTSGAMVASIGMLAKRAGYERSIIPMWLARIIIKHHLKQLEEKVCYWPHEEILWIKNFTNIQGSSPKFVTGAIKHAHNFPDHIRDKIIETISPNENTVKTTPCDDSPPLPDRVSDTVSDRVPDTHGRAEELQSNRVTEEQTITHSLIASESEILFLFKRFCELFPNKTKTAESPKQGSAIWNALEGALQTNNAEYWLNVFERAGDSAFLTGHKNGSQLKPFNMNVTFLINPDHTVKILAGEYDAFDKQGTEDNEVKF